jgi:hypothetical protein
MNFEIDPKYFDEVEEKKTLYWAKDPSNPTAEELVQILKYGVVKCESSRVVDHPEFDKLRQNLSQTGFINIQKAWWNGDRVLKPFMLNGKQFNAGDTFFCATAMRYVIEHI